MPGNSFGQAFRITTFGESHGGGVGVIVDGMTPGISLSEEDIQKELDRRKPGQSSVTTPRKEEDIVHLMSGVFEGKTTGTPVMMVIYNKDMRSADYNDIKNKYRPGHADFTYLAKYGIRDFRGSGRASGRETAGRVAAGVLARKTIEHLGVSVIAHTQRSAGIDCNTYDSSIIEKNPVRAADLEAASRMIKKIEELSAAGNSTGGIVECRIKGVLPGWGDPVFDKLDAEIAKAMLSLGAVKAIEFGTGFACADMTGSEHNDTMDRNGFVTNHAGGIIGGISTGAEIVFRIAVKPTSSITFEQKTVDIDNTETTIKTEGRHDPCICARIVPVVEAMAWLVLADQYKRQQGLRA